MFSDSIREAVRQTFARVSILDSEAAFQAAFAAALGNVECELRAQFLKPPIPPRTPPQSAIDDLARRSPAIMLPAEGKDPCVSRAKLDVLWHSDHGPVPIELKYRTEWGSDTYGYMVLKDVHRLERIHAAGRYTSLSAYRYVVFVTTQAVFWEGRRPEPQPFWLRDGTRLKPGQWFQYDQPSPDTQWWRYPPFYLAGSYELLWEDLGPAGRMLLIEIPAVSHS